ncbi:MAG: hypothetical protein NVSMB57_05460 [Actinomycetota bacterium]
MRRLRAVLVVPMMLLVSAGLIPSAHASSASSDSFLSLSAAPRAGVWGTAFTVSGSLFCKGSPLSFQRVRLHHFVADGVIPDVAVNTDEQGMFSTHEFFPRNLQVQATSINVSPCPVLRSGKVRVEVRPGVSLNAPSTATLGTTVVMNGAVKPRRPHKLVQLQVLDGVRHRWRFVAWGTLNRFSRYVFHYRNPTTRRFLLYRVLYPSQDSAFAAGISRRIRIDWNGRNLIPVNPACDGSYPTVCIPSPPPLLTCNDVPFRNFEVLPPDPHNFDPAGTGRGCVAP